MSFDNVNSNNKKIIERFVKEYLPKKNYYRHSDLDIFVNFTITDLLNYSELLTEEAKNFIQMNFNNNYNYYD